VAGPAVGSYPLNQEPPIGDAAVGAPAPVGVETSFTGALLDEAVAHTTPICDLRRVPASGGRPLDSPAP